MTVVHSGGGDRTLGVVAPREPTHELVPRDTLAPEDRPPLLPGRNSRRKRMNVWVPR